MAEYAIILYGISLSKEKRRTSKVATLKGLGTGCLLQDELFPEVWCLTSTNVAIGSRLELSQQEVRDALQALGFKWIDSKQAQDIVKHGDANNDEVLDFEEFVKEAP